MRLSDITESIVDCEHKTAPRGDGFAYAVGTKAMKGGRLVLEGAKPVSEETYAGWTRRMRPVAGDLILAREAPVGDVVRVPDEPRVCLGQRTVLIRPDADKVNPRFLHYWLLGPDAQGVMRAQTGGATVGHLNVGDIRKLDVAPMPTDPHHQANVAEVLGAIDDLIENNRRRVAVLEEMARAVYREWFVKLRYPGHGDVPMVDSGLGLIPEGWQAPQLAAHVSTQYGYTESASKDPVGPKYLRGMDINKTSFIDWSSVPYCPIEEGVVGKFRVSVGDVFVIRMADPGKVGICETEVDAVFASYLVRMRPTNEALSPYFLFYTLSGDAYQAWVTGASTGATRKSASAKVMTEPRVVLPPVALQQKFVQAIVPMRSEMTALVAANAKLASLRDVLLPKLVTGQIDVSTLDLDALVSTGSTGESAVA